MPLGVAPYLWQLVAASGYHARPGGTERRLAREAAPDPLFSSLPCPAFAVSGEGAVVAWNAAAEDAYGWRAEVALSRLPPILRDGARERFLVELARVMGGEPCETIQLTCTLRDGRAHVARLTPRRLPDDAGALFLDVARLERSELERAKAERDRFQSILDAIPAPIWFKNSGGVYQGCNVEFERYVGLPRDRIVGKTVFDIAPRDLAEVYRPADLDVFASGGTQVYETQVQWANGTRREVVFRKAAIRDAAGKLAGLAGAILDVSELRSAERELRARLAQQAALGGLAARALEEEDHPRALLEHAVRVVVGAQGADGGSVVEIAFEDGRRVSRLAAAAGLDPEGACPPFADDAVVHAVLESGRPLVVANGDAFELPAPLRAAGALGLAAVLIGSREAPLGVLSVFRKWERRFSDDDVQTLEATAHLLAMALGRARALQAARTAQERLARAERLAAIGTLAAGVAHELNNPLTFVLSNIEFVADAARKLRGQAADADRWDEASRALDDAAEGAERMRLIVRDLRAMARSDEAVEQPVEVRRVVEYAVQLASSEVRRRARLTWDLAPVPPVLGNEARLGQVFLNLLVNAAHAIPEGSPDSNEVRVAARLAPEGRVLITVSDTGAGIAPEIRTRIFDPFFTTKPVGQGTGLGLWVCHNIVAAHGGTIDVESAPGRGTTFRVTLLAAPDTAGAGVDDAAAAIAERPRVLVVDDEPLVAATVRRHLSGTYAVDAASGTADALARIRGAARYDAVVCDLVLPGGGGVALLEALQSTEPGLARHFLFVTGGPSTEETERLAAIGQPSLERPFDAKQLRAALQRVLSAA